MATWNLQAAQTRGPGFDSADTSALDMALTLLLDDGGRGLGLPHAARPLDILLLQEIRTYTPHIYIASITP